MHGLPHIRLRARARMWVRVCDKEKVTSCRLAWSTLCRKEFFIPCIRRNELPPPVLSARCFVKPGAFCHVQRPDNEPSLESTL
jgi:hypothetical protein